MKRITDVRVAFEANPPYYRSEYEDYFNISTVKQRIRNIKEYYVVQEMTLTELKQFELMQMQEHLEQCKKVTSKYFNRFLKSYITVDNGLMLDMIENVTQSAQQAYKMRIQWNRAKEERKLNDKDLNIIKQLRTMTVSERNQIKGMYEYNKRYVKNV